MPRAATATWWQSSTRCGSSWRVARSPRCARMSTQAGEKLTLSAAEQALRTELAALDTGVMAAEAELTARGDTDLGDEMVRVEQLRERARGIAAVLVERRRSMERDRGQLMDSGVVANLEADAQRLRDELAGVEADLLAVGPEAEELAAEEAAFSDQRRETLASIDGISNSTSAASAAAEVRGELRSMRGNLERRRRAAPPANPSRCAAPTRRAPRRPVRAAARRVRVVAGCRGRAGC